MPAHYDALPQSSFEFEDDGGEFKDRRARSFSFSYLLAVLRKARRIFRPLYVLVALIALLTLQLTLNTSYLHPPHFHASADESVFIAANIIDASLLDGAWGNSLLDLVDLIGKDRVYVSIYGGPTDALERLEDRLPCEKSLVSEKVEPIDLDGMPHTTLHTGESKIKRIAYLAEVRNRALKPLDSLTKKYDRVLFLNDVFFDAKDAVRLLWGTNVNEVTGKAEYKAACGTDFVTSWKYYDTFATRDTEGYGLGVPIFPWFSNEGEAHSRRDVLDQRSAVRVKSCWGGIVAFDGRYFQKDATASRDVIPTAREEEKGLEPVQLPIRFRSVLETFWDASECCLVHADLMAAESLTKVTWGTGIYMNPYVRVSYDAKTHSRLWLTKRFERLFVPLQRIINYLAKMPRFNARRTEIEGHIYKDRIWVPTDGSPPERRDASPETALEVVDSWRRSEARDSSSMHYWRNEGKYVDYERTAKRGGYCGTRHILVLREGSWDDGNWDRLDYAMPPLESELRG